MNDLETPIALEPQRAPWNKGKLTSASATARLVHQEQVTTGRTNT
jgi:hypothetical protein